MVLEDEKRQANVSHIDSAQVQESTTADPLESSPWKAIVANPKIVALCLYANLGALMYGFDNLVLSLALTLPAFSYAILPLLMPARWMRLLTSS
jgi:SP family general alpha glucoside:H+ symporter-like MFS transporter